MIKYCHRLVYLTTECPLLKDAFSCCKDLHSKGKTSWYSSIDILLKILNIDLHSKGKTSCYSSIDILL